MSQHLPLLQVDAMIIGGGMAFTFIKAAAKEWSRHNPRRVESLRRFARCCTA